MVSAVLTPAQEISVEISQISYRYREIQALKNLSLSIAAGEIFGVLGPNGCGKTTLFRLLSTLLPLQDGEVSIQGISLRQSPALVRHQIGVTFQSPSLDGQLTVLENLNYQARFYGLSRSAARSRIQELLAALNLTDRQRDRAGILSGGLKRRVEIAKSLLHHPQVLLLDEPSTGLDPGSRIDMWQLLRRLQAEHGITILLTTHLMEEAERCQQLAILDRGELVASGSPEELLAPLQGHQLVLKATEPEQLFRQMQQESRFEPQLIEGTIRLDCDPEGQMLAAILQRYGSQLLSIAQSRPTLEDVFLQKTGRIFQTESNSESQTNKKSSRRK